MDTRDEDEDDEDDYESCALEFALHIGPRYGEPSEYVLQYEGKVVSGSNFKEPVGEMTVYVADLESAYLGGDNPIEVLDSVDSGLAHFCNLLTAKGEFKPSVERHAGIDIGRLLVLGNLSIEAEYRGRGLGLQAIKLACDGLGQGCPVAALKAFPTQWEGRVDEGPQQFSRDRAKLIRYYRLAGFTPVIGGGLMVSSLPLNTTNKAHHEEG